MPEITIPREEILELVKDTMSFIDEDNIAEDDEEASIDLTVACDNSGSGWSYQTGDNSFTGGAYGLPHWAVVSIYKSSNPEDIVKDIFNQWSELINS